MKVLAVGRKCRSALTDPASGLSSLCEHGMSFEDFACNAVTTQLLGALQPGATVGVFQ